jgi:hypothetical protein
MWHGMLDRCYNTTNSKYSTYGGMGVRVDPRWYSLSSFILDLPLIDGYDRDKIYRGELQLDKDLKQQNIDTSNKVYSVNTCTFLSATANAKLTTRSYDSRKKSYIALDPNGKEYSVHGIKSFCREHLIDSGAVFGMLRGETTHVKGWKFKRLKD